jgi:hypothetical protein
MLDKKINNAYPHSQAHLQFAQAIAQTKNCKRACLSATADFADTQKTKSFKTKNVMTALKTYLKQLTDRKNTQLQINSTLSGMQSQFPQRFNQTRYCRNMIVRAPNCRASAHSSTIGTCRNANPKQKK